MLHGAQFGVARRLPEGRAGGVLPAPWKAASALDAQRERGGPTSILLLRVNNRLTYMFPGRMFTALHRPQSEYDAPAPFAMPSYASVMGQFNHVRDSEDSMSVRTSRMGGFLSDHRVPRVCRVCAAPPRVMWAMSSYEIRETIQNFRLPRSTHVCARAGVC